MDVDRCDQKVQDVHTSNLCVGINLEKITQNISCHADFMSRQGQTEDCFKVPIKLVDRVDSKYYINGGPINIILKPIKYCVFGNTEAQLYHIIVFFFFFLFFSILR